MANERVVVPEAFRHQMQHILGAESEAFFQAMQQPAALSVRLNDKLSLTPDYPRVSHCERGFFLPFRPVFTLDPWFHAGVYYVQESSSMYLEQVLNKYVQVARPRVLDVCAAPGGKSTHLATWLPEGSLLVSNEIHPQRAQILAENMVKWGAADTLVTRNGPTDLAAMEAVFDVLLTDVPCSGEGMFRKEAQAVVDWSVEAVKHCAARQREILRDVWSSLKPGGLLVYSTCTFNTIENEENVAWIAAHLGADVLESRHFYFHTSPGEGLFMAALRKHVGLPYCPLHPKVGKKETPGCCVSSLKHAERFDNLRWQQYSCAVAKEQRPYIEWMVQHLQVLKCGVHLSVQKGRDEIPDTALALSKSLQPEAWPTVELDRATALRYLRHESIVLPGVPKGYVLLCYRQVPFAFTKNVGNRCNNLYPEHWRIRMEVNEHELGALPF